jgi:hypothetical protein
MSVKRRRPEVEWGSEGGGLAGSEMLYDQDQRVSGFPEMISTHAQFS